MLGDSRSLSVLKVTDMFRVRAALCFILALPVSGQDSATLRLDRHDLTVMGVTIGSSNKLGVQSKLGKTATFTVHHADEREDALCYRSASDDTAVVFYFGALGGWTDVTRISISNSKALEFGTAKCRSSARVSHDLPFLRGLRLGASSSDFVKVLGPPTRASENSASYYVSHKCPLALLPRKDSGAPDLDAPCEIVDSVEGTFRPQVGLEYVSFYHFVDK